MARNYDIGCRSCGYIWTWRKYDRPNKECPRCGVKTARRDKVAHRWSGYLGRGESVWEIDAVVVFGAGCDDLKQLWKECRGLTLEDRVREASPEVRAIGVRVVKATGSQKRGLSDGSARNIMALVAEVRGRNENIFGGECDGVS